MEIYVRAPFVIITLQSVTSTVYIHVAMKNEAAECFAKINVTYVALLQVYFKKRHKIKMSS